MTLNEYETIIGVTVPTADVTRVTAQITYTQRILEDLLGYTLDPDEVATNHYIEIGRTSTDCPCPDVDMDSLLAADAVVGAYRLFNYNRKEKTITLDPASDIHAVKLVKDGITFKTLDTDEYRMHFKHDIIKYLEACECCWCLCTIDCYCVQLAVDATWLWTTLPDDLDQVWAEMITYYSDLKKNIKSETLGPHSYNKFDDTPPEQEKHNLSVIVKYAGANGSARRILVV